MKGERIDRFLSGNLEGKDRQVPQRESGGPFPFLYTEAAEGRKDPCKRESSEVKLQSFRGG